MVIKVKQRKFEHPLVDKVFNYDLAKFEKDWNDIAVVGARESLYSQSPIKILATKRTPILPLNYIRSLLRNIFIQHMFDVLNFFIYFSDNTTFHNKVKDNLDAN